MAETPEAQEAGYTPFVEQTIAELTARQAKLSEEQRLIAAALEALKAPPRRRRRAKAASDEGSRDEALERRIVQEVTANPGIKVAELAHNLGVNTNHLHSVTSRMVSDKLIERDMVFLHPVETG